MRPTQHNTTQYDCQSDLISFKLLNNRINGIILDLTEMKLNGFECVCVFGMSKNDTLTDLFHSLYVRWRRLLTNLWQNLMV